MKLGLCVVGCGQYAQTFAQGIQAILGEIDLYFASRDRQRAEAYSQMFQGSGAFGSYQEAAADSRVEAMYLCTPHHLHLEHVAMAARAGKHVLLEKPISATLEDGHRIIAAAQEAGITLMVAENYRFMPAVRRCKELVDLGEVGELRMIQLQEEASFQPDQWRSMRDLNGGGVFIDGGIHKVHFLRYLAGEPEHIFAVAMPKALFQHEGEDGPAGAIFNQFFPYSTARAVAIYIAITMKSHIQVQLSINLMLYEEAASIMIERKPKSSSVKYTTVAAVRGKTA